MKRVQEAKKRAGVPASKRKSRIVAVEKHFVTETYFDEVASLRVPAGVWKIPSWRSVNDLLWQVGSVTNRRMDPERFKGESL
jgi:hypothetical protein